MNKVFSMMMPVLAAMVLSGAAAGADEVRTVNEDLVKEHQFQLGTEISYIRYREPSLDVTDKGMAYGIFGVYDYRVPAESFGAWLVNVYHIDGHFNVSFMDYTGSGTINDVTNYMVEPRFWIGKDLIVDSNSRITPYLGVGYRRLLDESGGKVSSTGAYGYDRLSQYLYVPVGVEYALVPQNGWEIRVNAEYDHLIHGWQTSYLSQAPTGVPGTEYPDLTNDQTRGYGLRASVDLIKKAGTVNFMVSPYVRYWNIKDSKIQTAENSNWIVEGQEPANNSTEIGIRLGVQF